MADEDEILPIESATLGPGVTAGDPAVFYADATVRSTSGNKRLAPRAFLEDPSESTYVDVDLGKVCDVSVVTVWHVPGCQYYSQAVEISTDGTFGESGEDDHAVSWTTGVGELGPVETAEGNAIKIDPPVRGRFVRHRCGKREGGATGVHFRGLEVRGTPAAEEEEGEVEPSSLLREEEGTIMAPWSANNYGHAYWPNGWRKRKEDKTQDFLCFETGYYGLELNMDNMRKARFATFGGSDVARPSYLDVLDMDQRSRMDDGLQEQELIIEIQQPDGKSYRAMRCLAGSKNNRCHARLWDAGRFVQNYEILELSFRSDDRSWLACKADLTVVSWPRSFSLTLKVTNTGPEAWVEGTAVHMELGQWSTTYVNKGEWRPKTRERGTSLECHVEAEDEGRVAQGGGEIEGISLKMSGYETPDVKLWYRPDFACCVAKLKFPKRAFKAGYTQICDYDVFDLTVENTSEESTYVPFMFQVRPANVTGVVPILLQSDGVTPTGIPVQLSKNWHNKEMGAYVRAYCLLPAPASSSRTFKLTFVYGFYGTLPSASHAQLSLVGWNDKTNGRWEQMAIGCFGETHCLDAELSGTWHNMITDVRALMVRAGPRDKKWAWTSAGWGGDWLGAIDMERRDLIPHGVKAAYVSQGPCLTEVKYGGYYGAFGGAGRAKRISYLSTVRTLRTDDYARTFHSLQFAFHRHVLFANTEDGKQLGYLFRTGGANWEKLVTPRIAVGNAEGLIEEYEVPSDATANTFFMEDVELSGPGPWWVGFPGMNIREETKGQAWRALVIQSYQVTAGGETHGTPVVSFFVRNNDGGPNVDALLRPPKGVELMGKGDAASIDLYWITLPHKAGHYYGPNAALRAHLEETPDSWETLLREARGNDLKVEVTGGEAKETYPIIVQSSAGAAEVRLDITGGVGAVPMRFEGLDGGTYQLYKASSEEEDGQCDPTPVDSSRQVTYDAENFTFSVTYNILLDGQDSSSWVLKK